MVTLYFSLSKYDLCMLNEMNIFVYLIKMLGNRYEVLVMMETVFEYVKYRVLKGAYCVFN